MDTAQTIRKIRSEYDRAISADEKIAGLDAVAKTAIEKYRAASKIAERTGITTAEVLLNNLVELYPDGNIPEDAAKALTRPTLEHNHKYVSAKAVDAQAAMNAEAEVGLSPLIPDFDVRQADAVVEKLTGYDDITVHRNDIEKQIVAVSRKTVDDTMRINAEAHQSTGMKVSVTRIYDGIGVHNRKDKCSWCLSRCGEDMPYREAYDKGAFERHPGCGCEIFYKTGKSIQRQTNWQNNTWEEIQDQQALEMRQRYGAENDSFSVKEKISRIPQINNVTAEYLKDATPGIGEIIQEPGFTSKGHEEEKLFAQWLRNALGGDILQNKDSQTEGLHYADYTWRKGLWELKTVSTSKYNTFDQHVRKAEKQISTNRGGYLFDITKGTLSINDATALIGRSMKERKIQRTDVLIRKGNDYKILRIG